MQGARTLLPGPAAGKDANPHWMRACSVAATMRRAIVPVQLAGQQIIVIRDGHTLHALERACPHDRADLAEGRCVQGRLFCPRHRASFDLATGAVSPGWSFRAARSFPTRIIGPDVWIDLSPH